MPVERKAWACQYGCGRNVLTSRKRMEAHEARCWRNPARRACVACKHFNQYDDDNGMDGTPYLQTWHVRECLANDGIDISEKLRHDCPLWENAGSDASASSPIASTDLVGMED